MVPRLLPSANMTDVRASHPWKLLASMEVTLPRSVVYEKNAAAGNRDFRQSIVVLERSLSYQRYGLPFRHCQTQHVVIKVTQPPTRFDDIV